MFAQGDKTDIEDFVKMRNLSPIQHAHKVKAPTLLCVGSNDLRVPWSQAKDYYYRLKANGVVVKYREIGASLMYLSDKMILFVG